MNNLPVVGERIRDYEVLGRIGAGGMGVVFYARDLKLDRPVALKFLPGNLNYTTEEKRSLLREARIISALDHPNICTIHAVEETGAAETAFTDSAMESNVANAIGGRGDSRIFIVMGYYDGGTLADRIAGGPVPVPEILDLLTGMTLGLAAAHARRVVHRDIKPSNILLTREGVVKIVDFGLARIVSSSSQTQSLETSGTLAYMAPEQIQGEPVDHRADIWAVGVLAAEMLAGVHPFKRDNLAAVAFSICNQPPKIGVPAWESKIHHSETRDGKIQAGAANDGAAPSEAVPPELLRIIYKCLSKDPMLRYQNCDELLIDLRQMRGDLAGESAGKVSGPHSGLTSGISERKSAASQRRALERSMAAAAGSLPPKGRSRKWWWMPSLLAAVLLAAFAVPGLRARLAGAIFSPSEKHIAVLPFDVSGNDPGNDAGDRAMAGGLMDSMTGALSNLDADQKSLWVVPSSVVRSQHVDDPSSALKAVGATLVVKGSITHSGRDISLLADLINTRTMREIGSASASSSDGDFAAVQQEVVAQLGRLLNVSTAHTTGEKVASSAPAAYDLYLEALGYMQRFDKAGNLDLAIARLQTAIGEDPQFALGYATAGEAYRLKFEADNNNRWLQLALSNCQQAIKLNSMLPSAYVTLADVHAITGHSELAVDEFKHALSLDARNPSAISGLAWSYEQSGRLADAEAEYKKAMVLRPGDWYTHDRLALFYDRHGRYNEAIAEIKQAIELTPDNRNVYYDLGAFYLDAADPANYPAAEAALKRSLEISPNYPAYGNLALLYLEGRRYADAAAMADKALAINDQDLLPWSYSELAYRWLHEDAKADAALNHIQGLAEAAFKLNPQDGETQSWLGLAYARQGQRGKALPHIQAAMVLVQNDPQVLVNCIEAYVMIGDESTALRLMQQAKQGSISLADLKLDPHMQVFLSRNKL